MTQFDACFTILLDIHHFYQTSESDLSPQNTSFLNEVIYFDLILLPLRKKNYADRDDRDLTIILHIPILSNYYHKEVK